MRRPFLFGHCGLFSFNFSYLLNSFSGKVCNMSEISDELYQRLHGFRAIKAAIHADNSVKRKFIQNIHNVEDEYLKNNPSQKIFEKGHRNRFKKY